MKNLKTTIIAATLAFCCFTPTNAQNAQSTPIKGIIVKGGHNPKPTMMVSLNANGGTSSSPGVDNSLSFNPSLGIAIHWKNFGIGLDAGMFNTKPNFDFDAYTAPLQNLDFLTITNTKSDWTSTYFMLGPEYTIPLNPSPNKESGRHTPFHNKLTFTVALKGGLTLNKAPEFSVMDSNTPPKSIASYTAPQDYKTNAFSLKPSIGFAYWINENLALTANAQYLMQTGQQEFTTGYRDLTNVNLAPPISPIQFQEAIVTAPKVMTTTKGPENYMSFGFGFTYSFNKGGGDCDDTSDITSNETQRNGITEGGLPKNEIENVATDDIKKGWDGRTVKGGTKTELEITSNETQRKGITEGGLPKNDESVNAGISENKELNAVEVKMTKADSGKNSKADRLKTENKSWTCPCCKSEFADYAPSHETKCCDLKFALSDVKRPFNENDDVTFVENIAISIRSNKSSAIIPSQIALVYKIKQDDKGKLYGIPSVIFGIDIPQDSIPNYTLGCNSPCAVIGIAGNCGGFCYRLLPFDHPPQDYGPSEGPIAFNPNSTGTIVFIKDEKLTSIEQTNINSVKYIISTTGNINTAKIFSNSNFCYTHIEGYGTIAFEQIFSATCETASIYIKELYTKTHKTQQKGINTNSTGKF